MTSALELYQAHLDLTTPMVFSADTADYCAHAPLPFVFCTGMGTEVIETEADLAADIRQIGDWLRSQGVTDFHRIARAAQFLDDDTIEGFHTTYALRRALPVVDPYESRLILRRSGDVWKASFGQHEIADPLHPHHLGLARPGLFSPGWSRAPGGVRRSQAEALPEYSGFLEEMTAAMLDGDFEGWAALFRFPCDLHYDTGDYTVPTTEAARGVFDTMRTALEKAGADRIERQASFAAFIADDRLLGYHDTSLTGGGTVRIGPIKSRMQLLFEDGRWRCCSATNSLTDTGFPDGRFEPTEILPTMREIQQRMKT
jgi:hypothetical protein